MTHQVKGEYCTPLFLIRDCRQKLATYYYYYYFITSHVSTHHSVLPLEAVATLIMRVCEATCPPIYAPSRLQLFAHGSVCIYVDGHRRPAPSPPPPPPAPHARHPCRRGGGSDRPPCQHLVRKVRVFGIRSPHQALHAVVKVLPVNCRKKRNSLGTPTYLRIVT